MSPCQLRQLNLIFFYLYKCQVDPKHVCFWPRCWVWDWARWLCKEGGITNRNSLWWVKSIFSILYVRVWVPVCSCALMLIFCLGPSRDCGWFHFLIFVGKMLTLDTFKITLLQTLPYRLTHPTFSLLSYYY